MGSTYVETCYGSRKSLISVTKVKAVGTSEGASWTLNEIIEDTFYFLSEWKCQKLGKLEERAEIILHWIFLNLNTEWEYVWLDIYYLGYRSVRYVTYSWWGLSDYVSRDETYTHNNCQCNK